MDLRIRRAARFSAPKEMIANGAGLGQAILRVLRRHADELAPRPLDSWEVPCLVAEACPRTQDTWSPWPCRHGKPGIHEADADNLDKQGL